MPSTSALSRRAALRLVGGIGTAAVGLCFAVQEANAKASRIYTGRFSNLALGGYDPVAYFTEGKPIEGSRQFTTEWNGATWRFASLANLEAFRREPDRYAPRYGGYCAWATAQNYLAPGDPKIWRIVGGRLYVNYDSAVQEKWEKDIQGFIKSADANWPSILDRN